MLHKIFKTIHQVPTLILLVAFILSGLITVWALRSNNQQMLDLRNAVFVADKNGEGVDVDLNNLRNYVYSHMNTDLSSGGNNIKPPIQLKYTYERLQKKEQQRVNTTNLLIYTQAQKYCEQQNSTAFSGRTRVPCIQEYVTQNGGSPQSVPAALYQFDFVSPAWSPDLAGWSLVLTVILLIATVGSFIIDRLVKSKLKTA